MATNGIPTSHGTQLYLESREAVDELGNKVMTTIKDKNSPEFILWLGLHSTLSAMLDFMGVIFSHVKEVKNNTAPIPKNGTMPDWVRLAIVGILTGIITTIGGWLFTDILPRIFSITVPPIIQLTATPMPPMFP